MFGGIVDRVPRAGTRIPAWTVVATSDAARRGTTSFNTLELVTRKPAHLSDRTAFTSVLPLTIIWSFGWSLARPSPIRSRFLAIGRTPITPRTSQPRPLTIAARGILSPSRIHCDQTAPLRVGGAGCGGAGGGAGTLT